MSKKNFARMSSKLYAKGVAGGGGSRIRLARTEDLPAAYEYLTLAWSHDGGDESTWNPETGPMTSPAILAGMNGGRDQYLPVLAEGAIAGELTASVLLVAEHEKKIIGAIMCTPPMTFLSDSAGQLPGKKGRDFFLTGIFSLTKIQAVGVAAHYRGRGIGKSLIMHARNIYSHCGTYVMYGSYKSSEPLEEFYSGLGFTIYPVDEPIDLSWVFDMNVKISNPGYRMVADINLSAKSQRKIEI